MSRAIWPCCSVQVYSRDHSLDRYPQVTASVGHMEILCTAEYIRTPISLGKDNIGLGI